MDEWYRERRRSSVIWRRLDYNVRIATDADIVRYAAPQESGDQRGLRDLR